MEVPSQRACVRLNFYCPLAFLKGCPTIQPYSHVSEPSPTLSHLLFLYLFQLEGQNIGDIFCNLHF